MKEKLLPSKIIMSTFLTGAVLIGGTGVSHAQASTSDIVEQTHAFSTIAGSQTQEATKYSKKVMRELRESLSLEKHSTKLDYKINEMPKVEVMDRYLKSFGKKIKGKEVRRAVEEVFGADLNYISKHDYGSKLNQYNKVVMETVRETLKRKKHSVDKDAVIMSLPKNEVMDRYIEEKDYDLTGSEHRQLINFIFGVNLDGISSIEHGKLSIYSKGQWLLQGDTNLFIISSSLDDVSLTIAPTDYFVEATGSTQLPSSLVEKLEGLGMTYDESNQHYYYEDYSGESIPESFKGQVMGSLMQAVTLYPNL